MVEKIKANLGKITLILSIVAGALLVPTTLTRIGNPLTQANLVYLIEYIVLIVANVLLIVCKDTKKIVPFATVLFYGAFTFSYVFDVINAQSFSACAMAVLYAANAVLAFIPKCKKAWQIVNLIAIAFLLASALGGGAVSFSIFVTSVVIAVNNHINNQEKE